MLAIEELMTIKNKQFFTIIFMSIEQKTQWPVIRANITP